MLAPPSLSHCRNSEYSASSRSLCLPMLVGMAPASVFHGSALKMQVQTARTLHT